MNTLKTKSAGMRSKITSIQATESLVHLYLVVRDLKQLKTSIACMEHVLETEGARLDASYTLAQSLSHLVSI